jgi:aristolochene synthase
MYGLWESMRKHDLELANEVLEPTFVFMRSQTDKIRLSITELGEYLRYREKDVGKAYVLLIPWQLLVRSLTQHTSLLSALMRFSMDLHPTSADLAALRPLEENCSKHISVVNDIYSFDKELFAAKTGHPEGSYLCSAVKVLATETSLGISATKRVLWTMVREWELVHEAEAAALVGRSSAAVRDYVRGLRCQMSGNELWSKTTPRYLDPMQDNAEPSM